MLKRLEPPTDDTPTSLSRELNIPRTTIYQWIRKDNENKKNSYNKPTNKWTSEDKFYAVMGTATLTETELAEYEGEYFKLYLIVDMFSRFIVAYEVWEEG